jgi:NitT/TauT family transport system permease protein
MKFRKSVFLTSYQGSYPNIWDVGALVIVFAVIVLLSIAAKQMSAPFNLGHTEVISLAPSHLPGYALRTVMRMFMAMACSLIFTFVFGTWAAKSRHAERVIIPFVDVLQSVPVLGFLSISVPMFIGLFPHSMLGPEFAAVFAIFTSQAWNMLLGFYQQLKTVPGELVEVADMFHLNKWQRFWRVEVPTTIPSLLWNMMLSMSAGWFFVVAAEAISVANQEIMLPGIGSYIAVAISHANVHAIIFAIVAMLIVILLYDQLLFRPLVAWSEKFKVDLAHDDVMAESWVVDIFRNTRWMRKCGSFFAFLRDAVININLYPGHKKAVQRNESLALNKFMLMLTWLANFLVYAAIAFALFLFLRFILRATSAYEIFHVFGLGFITAFRVMVLIAICSLIWIPIGVWVGLRPGVASIAQPVAQFLAAFPANLLYPIVVMVIIHYNLNVEIWTSPLMVLGTQWYILFNVIAGASVIPKELLMASELFQVRGWVKWRAVILPAIFPYFITGAMTAAGGAWNASIVAEVVSWGSHTLKATGLGAYISETTQAGQTAQEALGIVVMCLFVIVINRLVWRPLYRLAEERFHIE